MVTNLKKRASGLIIIVIFLITPFLSVCSGIEVNINDASEYDVIKSSREISVGTNSASAEGFEIDGHHFSQGTSVKLNITTLGFLGTINYNISSNGYSEIRSVNTLVFFFSILYQIYQPMVLINEYSNASE